jgi:transporter family-2 protein
MLGTSATSKGSIMHNYIIYALWAFAAGTVIPIMATLNAQLARSIDNAPIAVVILHFVGFIGGLIYLIAVRPDMPELSAFLNTKKYLYMGGFLMAFYGVSVTLVIPRFGVGNTILFILSAQICISAIIDNWGLFGVPVRPVSWIRLLGIMIMFAGLALIQFGATKNIDN